MQFQAPAGIDDLADAPDLRDRFLALWNDDSDDGFVGSYVKAASQTSPNYVDPRVEAPTADAVAIPWNGFPRALSRWFDDELSTAAREEAEATADIGTPILSWVMPVNGRLRLHSAEAHRVRLFGAVAVSLARPLRRVGADGALGDETPQMRRQQDEYLEWHPTHDAAGRLVALTFTAEPPDYWTALARVAPQRVVELYQRLVGPQVREEDLFHATDLAAFGVDLTGQQRWFNIGRKGEYDPLNPWTTTRGIVHLTHRANTLGAEVQLAAESSLVWQSDLAPAPTDPNPPRPEIRRIACGGYGGINRSSDPLIGLGVGDNVLANVRVTLTDPIGLYIANIGLAGLTGPQGQAVGMRAVQILRGQEDPFEPRMLRFEVRLPADLPFRLDECRLEGRSLKRGGQVARVTTMQLYAQPYQGGADLTAGDCSGRPCRHPDRAELFLAGDVAEPCPNAQAVVWLSETPFEAPSADDFLAVREMVRGRDEDTGPVTTGGDVEAEPLLATSRAPGRP
jgi:hypothetical protein